MNGKARYSPEKRKTKRRDITEKFSESDKSEADSKKLKNAIDYGRNVYPVSKKKEYRMQHLDIKFIGRMHIMGNRISRNLCDLEICISSEAAPHISKTSETDRSKHCEGKYHNADIFSLVGKTLQKIKC